MDSIFVVTYLLKFIYTPQFNIGGTFMCIHRHGWKGEKFVLPNAQVSQLRLNSATLCILVSACSQ